MAANKQTIIRYSLWGLLALICAFAAFAFPETSLLIRALKNLTQAQAEVSKIETLFFSSSYEAALDEFPKLETNLSESEAELRGVVALKAVPILGSNISAMEKILEAINPVLGKTDTLANRFKKIFVKLSTSAKRYQSFEEVPREVKREILKTLFDSLPEIKNFQSGLDAAVSRIDAISHNPVLVLRPEIDKLSFRLHEARQGLAQAIPFMEILPAIAGYPDERTSLLFFMNNWEMRPGGGFLGTYGILKVQDSEIQQLKTDDIYNLDKPATANLTEAPPWQLQKYLQTQKWFLRDSNWSSDFDVNARKALELYRAEAGENADSLQGVVALDPTFVGELLKLTGPLIVDGQSFDSDNIHDELEWKVEKGYVGDRIPETQRKEIVGKLAELLKTSLLHLPLSRFGEILDKTTQALKERHLLLWSTDPEVLRIIRLNSWGGRVSDTDGDYLSVIDANLASLKTDEVMEKNVSYQVSEDKDGLLANVTIHYKNNGKFYWKWTRYRTYTRVFVPKGSTLVASSGAMENDKLLDPGAHPGKIEVGEEGNKTFFGAFISVEPREEKELSFTYRLPQKIFDQARANAYDLLIQKQSGTLAIPLTLSLHFAKVRKDMETDLRVDREVKIGL